MLFSNVQISCLVLAKVAARPPPVIKKAAFHTARLFGGRYPMRVGLKMLPQTLLSVSTLKGSSY